MDKRTFKNHAYGEIASLARAMAHPLRLEILDLLANGPKSVEEMATIGQASMASTSQQLQVLKNNRLVVAEKRGKQVFYALASRQVYDAWMGLKALTSHVNPFLDQYIRTFREPYGTEQSLGTATLSGSDYLVVDVRPVKEYLHGHLPDAVSIPMEQLAELSGSLPRDKRIVAYCRGEMCTYADEAVKYLREMGFQADRMDVSISEMLAK
ncbi:MAG: metalloregulator ArsR/SmtB family transcription factor [Cyclobacteriaceae bacterium]|nr:metalloregulator ArsR/SmtB family transcription factor [Cyclobacteriaceae bacterium]